MKILKSNKFLEQLRTILRFIALDSPAQARIFKRELNEKIKYLDDFPYKYRRSIHFESEEIRDMIFKGYVIPYFVDMNHGQIIVIAISKYKDEI